MTKKILHWVIVFATVAAGLHIGHVISDSQLWLEWRYAASNAIQALAPRPSIAKYTSVVLIGTDDYWSSPLAARVPINRRYLAELLREISRGDPYLVALDFDMRSPDPTGTLIEFPEFVDETRDLIAQIRMSAKEHHVVLPRAVWAAPGHRYQLDSDVWKLAHDLFDLPQVHGGYIALPPDLRKVPLAVPLVNSSPLDSFSLAIARTREKKVTDLLKQTGGREKLPFASYIPETEFSTHTAKSVFQATAASLKEWFSGRLVLVGGSWTRLAANRGARIDSYMTPEGVMPGVFVHANYVEALLDQRTFEPAAEWAVSALEVAVVLTCIIVLGLPLRTWTKAAIYISAFFLLVVVNYLSLHNFGRFFDFFVPLVVIVCHLIFEQVVEWRHQAHARHSGSPHAAPQATLIVLATAGWLTVSPASEALGNTGWHLEMRGAIAPTEHQTGQALASATCSSAEGGDDETGPTIHDGVDPIAPTITGGARKNDPMGQPIETMGGPQGSDRTPHKADPLEAIDEIMSE